MSTMPHHQSPVSDELRPEVIKFIDEMTTAAEPYPSLMDIPVVEAREIAEKIRTPFRLGGPCMATTEERQLDLPSGSIKIRIYSPSNDKNLPCLFYIHGGGWILFSLDTHDRLMREYAAGANMRVIGIDYSLAPEKKHPSQIHEISDVILWCITHAEALDIDPEKLAIGGDSAGANLTVASCLTLRDAGHANSLHAMVLNYGVYDGRCKTESYQKYGAGEYLLSAEEMHWFWGAYLNTSAEALTPLASPILADVTGLPPTFMVITDHDVLYDENMHMKEHLEASKVDVEAKVYHGTTHSFLEATSFGGVACEAIEDTTSWLKTLWNKK